MFRYGGLVARSSSADRYAATLPHPPVNSIVVR